MPLFVYADIRHSAVGTACGHCQFAVEYPDLGAISSASAETCVGVRFAKQRTNLVGPFSLKSTLHYGQEMGTCVVAIDPNSSFF